VYRKEPLIPPVIGMMALTVWSAMGNEINWNAMSLAFDAVGVPDRDAETVFHVLMALREYQITVRKMLNGG